MPDVILSTLPGRDRLTRPFHLHAEHCDGPFYMGWWLYIDPVFDGRSAYCRSGPDAVRSRWLHGEFSGSCTLWEEVARLAGENFPRWQRYSDRFAERFAQVWPHGLLVDGVRADAHDLDWKTATPADASVREGWPNFHLERSIAAGPVALGREFHDSLDELSRCVASLESEVRKLKAEIAKSKGVARA